MTKTMVDYRGLRWNTLTAPKYRHLFLLLFWPIFGLFFTFLEQHYPVETYHPVYSPLDDFIPFNEWFLFFYAFWFVFVGGTVLYTLMFDVPAFRKTMYFIILTYGATVIFYLFYPTCQNLRPVVFPRDNLLTRLVGLIYRFDTNTNVCPSIHVIGSFAALFGCWNAKGLNRPWIRAALIAATILICLSTVFLKQHSVVDVFAALPVCAAGWLLIFWKRPRRT